MFPRIDTRHTCRLLRPASEHDRLRAPLALALGLSQAVTLVPLLLAPLGLGIGRAVWTPLLALAFFAARATATALASLVRARNLAVLGSALRAGSVHTALLVAGSLTVALHQLAENPALRLGIGLAGALHMGAAQACIRLEIAHALARLEPLEASRLIRDALAAAVSCVFVCALLPFAGAAALFALAPLAYRPLIEVARGYFPLETQAQPEAGPPEPAFSASMVRRSAAIVLLVSTAGVYAPLATCAARGARGALETVCTLVGLAAALVAACSMTRRLLLLARRSCVSAPLATARLCLPLVATASIVAGLVPELWPLVIALSGAALLVMDEGLLIASLSHLRSSTSDEGAFETACTAQAVGAAFACWLGCLREEALHPLPALLLVVALLLLTYALCVPAHGWHVVPCRFGGGEIPAETACSSDPGASMEPPDSYAPPVESAHSAASEQEGIDLDGELARLAVPIARGDLTRRQAQVYVLLMRGLSPTDICRELEVTRPTLNTHLQDIYYSFGVHSRAELADITDVLMRPGLDESELPQLPGRRKRPRRVTVKEDTREKRAPRKAPEREGRARAAHSEEAVVGNAEPARTGEQDVEEAPELREYRVPLEGPEG